MKSGRSRKIVGILDVGNDVGRFPQRVRGDRPQADGPVAAPAGARCADDVELYVAAQWMPLKRVSHPSLDLLEGGGCLCKERLEVHLAPPSNRGFRRSPRRQRRVASDLISEAGWLTAR